MDRLSREIRLGIRQLGRRRAFTLMSVLTLATGIAATTVVFSLLYGALLRPPPFPDADRLVMLYRTATPENRAMSRWRWSWRRFQLLESLRPASIERIAAFTRSDLNLGGDGRDPEQVGGETVSAGYFSVLGVSAAEGRTFRAAEDSVPGRDAVAVISHSLWMRRFVGDPAMVGRDIAVNGVPMTVIGIMPAGFAGLTGRADLWILHMMAPRVTYAEHLTTDQNFISAVGLLRAGQALDRVEPELQRIGERVAAALPDETDVPTRWGATAERLADARIDPANRRSLILLFAAVAFLLLLACANLGGLGVAHAVTRTQEMAVRLAIGARRADLVRQLMTESALVGAAGGTLGVLLAIGAVRFFTPPESIAGPLNMYGVLGEFASTHVDARVLVFSIFVSLSTVVLSGLVPALHAGRTDLANELRARGSGATRRPEGLRPASVLVVIEVAIAMVLAVGSGLLFASLQNLESRTPGFRPDHLLTFRIQPSAIRYDTDRAPEVIDRVLAAVAALPGVTSVTVDACAPLGTSCASNILFTGGRALPPPGEAPSVSRHYVGWDHFETLGIPLVRGRSFSPDDRAGRPGVTIINETAARRFWPGEDPIGRRVWFAGSGFTSPDSSAEIIGIVGDVQYGPVQRGMPPSFYTPYRQFTYASRMVIVRTGTDPHAMVAAVRTAVRSVDDLPVFDVSTMEERLGATWSRARFNARLMGGFAILAIVLAAAGIHGVMSHSVGQRRREMGIRMAIGASARDVLRLVVGQGLLLGAVGVGAGLVGAFTLTRFMRALLFEVSALDPLVYLTQSAVLLAAAIVASWLPARRATRVDPARTLRAG